MEHAPAVQRHNKKHPPPPPPPPPPPHTNLSFFIPLLARAKAASHLPNMMNRKESSSTLVVFLLLGCASFATALVVQTRYPAASRQSSLATFEISSPAGRLYARRDDEDYEEFDLFDEYDEDDDEEEYQRRRRRRKPSRRRRERDNLGGGFDEDDGLDIPSAFGRRGGWRLPDSVSKALLAGVFVLGIGLGVTVDSAINTNPRDLASRDAIDQAAPNPTLCATMGASAMAFDQRVFVSFNPFNVYVAQADVKPGESHLI